MGATQDDGIYLGVFGHQFIEPLLDKVVGSRAVCLVVFYQRHPEGASHARDGEAWPEFLDLHIIAVALHGALGGQQADVAAPGELADDLDGGPDYAQYAPRRIPLGQIVLLYGAQSLGRGRVAAQYDQLASHLEEFEYSLAGKLVHDIKRAGAIGSPRIVA